MKTIKTTLTLLTLLSALFLTQSCKNKNPSVAKVFVRSASNELVANSRVVIIADVTKNESKIEYVDTLITNTSGYAEFNLEDYFNQAGKQIDVGQFFILGRKDGMEGSGTIRARVHTTAVETIYVTQ